MSVDGAPTVLLELLEGYVLATIDELATEDSVKMGEVARRLFGGGDDWRANVRRALQIGVELDAGLLKLWEESSAAGIAPGDFARMVVDENFRPMLGA